MTALRPGDPTPWELALSVIELAAPKDVSSLQRDGGGLCGLVVAAWTGADPLSASATHYWSGLFWEPFGDPHQVEAPYIYKTKRGLLRRARWPRRLDTMGGALDHPWSHWPADCLGVGVISWVHPDADAEPLERYAQHGLCRMIGSQPFRGRSR